MPRPRTARALASLVVATALAIGLTGPATAAPPPSPPFGPAIDRYSAYEGQRSCTAAPTPGIVALQDLVTRAYPQFAKGYLLRACQQGGTSEHKDGRAWDMPVAVADPEQRAGVEELLGWLTAPDEYGNRDARLRRMGVMYIIWNQSIFKAYDRTPGWYPYTGPDPHSGHVHFSLGGSGAQQTTSWGLRTWGPSAGLSGAGQGFDLVTRTPSGSPVHRTWQPGSGVGTSTSLGGTLVGGVGAVRLADGGMLVAGRGTDDQLYVNRRSPDGRWSSWQGLGGTITTRPSVAGRPGGGADIAVRGTDGQVYLMSSDAAGAWLGWTPLGGTVSALSGPGLVYVGDRLELVVGWSDDTIRRRSRTGSTWGAWSVLGGTASGDVALSAERSGLVMAVRGSDQAMWVRTIGAGDSGWQGLGGVLASPPSLSTASDGARSYAVVEGTDGRRYRARHDAAGWAGWTLLD